jgi:multidrug efflux pump subunit AcrB
VKRVLAWFATNGVAANLIMVVILVGGLITIGVVNKKVFPEVDSSVIRISVPYLGAAPEEVEEAVCVRIEEAIQGLEGIEEITSSAAEGTGTVTVEVDQDYDTRDVMDDVKARVDAIDTFPEQTERPVFQEIQITRQVINIAIHGRADEQTLKTLGERVRDELASLPGISQTEMVSTRPYEISIEVSEENLRRHGLTFDEVVTAVRRSSIDLPGGALKTEGGEILLRSKGQAYRGAEFERIVLLTRPDGTYLRLRDVARVVDGFADTDQTMRFDGDSGVMVRVFRVGDQSALEIAATVKQYVARARERAPEGIHYTVWQDDARILRGRMNLLLKNGLSGFVLVFICLALFLRLRLAFWVTLGIPISFLGTLWLMPALGLSINLLTLFAFIVVLGIVVDDAIVVGESIYTEQDRVGRGLEASILGVQRIHTPVIFAVLTSVVAFTPLLFVEGNTGRIMRVIPLMVIPTLLFSLVESMLILPSHLSHARHREPRSTGVFALWRSLQGRITGGLDRFIRRIYQPALGHALQWRYLTLAGSVAVLLLTAGFTGGGWIKFSFFPPVEADNVVAMLTMPLGTPAEVTSRAISRLEQAALKVRENLDDQEGREGGSVFQHMMASVGEQPFRSNQSRAGGNVGVTFAAAHLGEVNIELAPAEERTIKGSEIAALWREEAGAIFSARGSPSTSSSPATTWSSCSRPEIASRRSWQSIQESSTLLTPSGRGSKR